MSSRDAIEKLKKRIDFDFDGGIDVALNPVYQEIYPFLKLLETQIF